MFERTRSFWRWLAGGERPGPGEGEDERRAWVRYAADREITIIPDSEADGPGLAARIQDVSRGGIRLLVGRPVESGAMLRVELPARNGHPTIVLACVVHASPSPSGEWSLGCSFSTELGDDDLRLLGGQRVRAPSADQRNWERFPSKAKAFYRPAAREDADPKPARLLNVSPNGAGLRVTEALDPGLLLSLEFENEAGKKVLSILGCVVYTAEQSDAAWYIGCTFIRELYDEDLRELI